VNSVILRCATGLLFLLTAIFPFLLNGRQQPPQKPAVEAAPPPSYLGFDVNDYPGDDLWPRLKKTFAFSGYWLNVPPGAKGNTWVGKREVMLKNGFGFLVLFNGRLSKELKPPVDSRELGSLDAAIAVAAAKREGFPAFANTIIYLDVEEGGRMTPAQMSYIQGWSEEVDAKSYVAGVYCSGMKVKEGKGQYITTIEDIYENARTSVRAFFAYNDACPPSPGCAYPRHPPEPAASGFSYIRVWQFAQSPRRKAFTAPCGSTYDADGNCYPPSATGAGRLLLDLDTAVDSDPSKMETHIMY
jgi:hypothetical protein